MNKISQIIMILLLSIFIMNCSKKKNDPSPNSNNNSNSQTSGYYLTFDFDGKSYSYEMNYGMGEGLVYGDSIRLYIPDYFDCCTKGLQIYLPCDSSKFAQASLGKYKIGHDPSPSYDDLTDLKNLFSINFGISDINGIDYYQIYDTTKTTYYNDITSIKYKGQDYDSSNNVLYAQFEITGEFNIQVWKIR